MRYWNNVCLEGELQKCGCESKPSLTLMSSSSVEETRWASINPWGRSYY